MQERSYVIAAKMVKRGKVVEYKIRGVLVMILDVVVIIGTRHMMTVIKL